MNKEISSIKVGIWGTGYISHTHVESLRRIGVNIVAVVGIDDLEAKTFANQYGIPSYGSKPELFFETKVDAVHVCTPPNLHYDMVKLLLLHDVHVLCEKPLCLDVSQAKELSLLAKERNLQCGVNLNVRYHPACRQMKEVVSDDAFGKVLFLHGSYLQEFHILPTQYSWRYNEKLGGTMRAVTEIGTHWIDLAEYMMEKKIVRVSAIFGNFWPERGLKDGMMYPKEDEQGETIHINSEDVAMIQFATADHIIGNVVLSEVSHGRINRLSMEVTGLNKSVWWNSEESTTLHVGKQGAGVQTMVNPFGSNGFTDTFAALVADFYKDQACVPNFEDGAHLSAVCEAIGESALQQGSWITV